MPVGQNRSLLICITHSFPFGIGDEHFEDELKILAAHTDELLLIPRANLNAKSRNIPSNAAILKIPFKLTRRSKFLGLTKLNWKVISDEMQFVKTVFRRRPNVAMLRIMIGSLIISTDLAQKLIPVINRYKKLGYEVHLYSYWNDLSAVALSLLKKKYPSIKASSRAHAFEIYDERHAMNYIPFQQLKFRSLDQIFFISSFGLSYIQARFRMLEFERCMVSGLGCFEMPGAPYAKDPACIRIISIGYNYVVKRIDLIGKSLRAITGLHAKWIHVGNAIQDMKQYEKMVDELINSNPGVECQFAGNLSRQQLSRLYADTTFDILLNVSPLEGIPVSMMECMSAGIPVIATAVGGVPEIVKDQFNGILLSADPFPEEVAAALQMFHSKSEAAIVEFRKNARITWEQNYNAATNYPVFAKKLLQGKTIS